MAEQVIPLTTLSEAQRRQALERFAVLRPALEEGASQTQIARDHQMALSTVQRWIKSYREKGLAGLAPATRSDKGKSRSLPEQAITLVEGLALQTPPRSAASIHRQVVEIAKEQGWKPPSYERVRLIIKSLDPALVTPIKEPLPIARNLIYSTGEKSPMPTPCGRPIIRHWTCGCWTKQANRPSPTSPRSKMITAG